jgi:hypothetical protein
LVRRRAAEGRGRAAAAAPGAGWAAAGSEQWAATLVAAAAGALASALTRPAPRLRCAPPAGTLIGCLPNNFMAAHAGDHLSDLHSLGDLYSPRMIGLGLVVGCIALLPVWWKHRGDRAAAAGGGSRGVKAE